LTQTLKYSSGNWASPTCVTMYARCCRPMHKQYESF